VEEAGRQLRIDLLRQAAPSGTGSLANDGTLTTNYDGTYTGCGHSVVFTGRFTGRR
jgi:hypothetical protein